MRKRFSILIVGVFVLTSCQTNHTKQTNIQNLIKISQELVVEANASEKDSIVTDCQVVPLETSEQCLLGELRGVRFYNNELFIASGAIGRPSELFVFDRQGRFLRKIGSIGRGPNEYLYLSTFFINPHNNELIILDDNTMKICCYDLNGDFLSKSNADTTLKFISQMDYMPDQHILATYSINFMTHDLYRSYNNDLKPSDLLATTPYTWQGAIPFAMNPVSICQQTVHLIKPFNDTIFQYQHENITPYYLITYKNGDKTLKTKKETDYTILKQMGERQDLYFSYGIVENNSYLMIKYLDGTILWDKLKNTGKYYDNGYYPDKLTQYPIDFLSIIHGEEDSFIQLQNAMQFKTVAESVCNNKINPKLQQMIDNLDDNSNPVLIIYHMKDNLD